MLKENIPSTVLMHILICLSYLSKERFSNQIEECNFVDRISDFVEYYNNLNTSSKQLNFQIMKETLRSIEKQFWISVHICFILKMFQTMSLKQWSITSRNAKRGFENLRTKKEILFLNVSRMK